MKMSILSSCYLLFVIPVSSSLSSKGIWGVSVCIPLRFPSGQETVLKRELEFGKRVLEMFFPQSENGHHPGKLCVIIAILHPEYDTQVMSISKHAWRAKYHIKDVITMYGIEKKGMKKNQNNSYPDCIFQSAPPAKILYLLREVSSFYETLFVISLFPWNEVCISWSSLLLTCHFIPLNILFWRWWCPRWQNHQDFSRKLLSEFPSRLSYASLITVIRELETQASVSVTINESKV